MVSLGDAHSGKSCLIKRYCEKKFVSKYISTIGVDFGVRQVPSPEVSGLDLKVNFCDLAGDPNLFQVRREFHAGAQAAILVYDVTDANSFKSLPRWISEHTAHGGTPCIVVLCANKIDEPASARTVSEAEGKKYAQANGFTYLETSAKTGQNVEQIFEAIFKAIPHKAG